MGCSVYSSTRDGNGELYELLVAGGASEKRLTTSTFNETQPVLNNAGSGLAFTSDAIGLPRLFAGPASLSSVARLTSAAFGFGGSIETDATWSATGDRVAFMSTANGRANLFITGPLPARRRRR